MRGSSSEPGSEPTGELVAQLRDRLAHAGLDHLVAEVDTDGAVSVRPADPDWRRYALIGLPDDEHMLARLQELEARCRPTLLHQDGGWRIAPDSSAPVRGSVGTPASRDELLDRFVSEIVRPWYGSPVLAFQATSTDEGFAFEVVVVADSD